MNKQVALIIIFVSNNYLIINNMNFNNNNIWKNKNFTPTKIKLADCFQSNNIIAEPCYKMNPDYPSPFFLNKIYKTLLYKKKDNTWKKEKKLIIKKSTQKRPLQYSKEEILKENKKILYSDAVINYKLKEKIQLLINQNREKKHNYKNDSTSSKSTGLGLRQ